jgi:hypothetical protein
METMIKQPFRQAPEIQIDQSLIAQHEKDCVWGVERSRLLINETATVEQQKHLVYHIKSYNLDLGVEIPS